MTEIAFVPASSGDFTDPENVLLKAGSFVAMGGRQYQEDRLVVVMDLNAYCEPSERQVMSATRRAYFAVFDGHGGHRCSEFLSNNLHKLLATNSKLRFSPLVALQEAWLLADAEVLADFQRKAHQEKNAQFPHDGSTATVCLIIDNECYIANCGDSAAFVEYSCGHIQKATEDHGTVNPSEVARCIEGGAHFTPQTVPARFGCLPFCPQRVEVGKPRLYPGGLLVTRAFGDFYAKLPIYGGIQTGLIPDHGEIELFQLNKDNSNKKTQPQDSNKSTSATTTSSFSARKVSPKGKTDGGATDPSVITRIILASDGVWDAYSPEDVQRHLAVARTSPQANRQPLPANDQNTGFPSFTALGSLDDEDVDLKHLARSLCTFAINSPIWGLQASAPDNTSCIIVEVAQPRSTRTNSNVNSTGFSLNVTTLSI